jgi:hypothetical protein
VIRNRFPEIGEQGDQEPVNCGPKISSDSISTNSYDMKIVYHDWNRAVKRSDDIFGPVLRYKRHELDSRSTNYPVWLLWRLFSERLWLVLRIRASRHQIPHGLPAHDPALAFCAGYETPSFSFCWFPLAILKMRHRLIK